MLCIDTKVYIFKSFKSKLSFIKSKDKNCEFSVSSCCKLHLVCEQYFI